MTAAIGIASSLQVPGGGGGGTSPGALDCLGLLLALVVLPILAYCFLKIRGSLSRSGKAKPDFPSIRSTGKTVVSAPPPDDDDAGQFGDVN